AATGSTQRATIPRATAPAGHRTPTVGIPAVTTSGMRPDRGSTSVNGPGQNREARTSASLGQWATYLRAWPTWATWTSSGLIAGRPFAAKIRATAAGSVAIAPRP